MVGGRTDVCVSVCVSVCVYEYLFKISKSFLNFDHNLNEQTNIGVIGRKVDNKTFKSMPQFSNLW